MAAEDICNSLRHILLGGITIAYGRAGDKLTA